MPRPTMSLLPFALPLCALLAACAPAEPPAGEAGQVGAAADPAQESSAPPLVTDAVADVDPQAAFMAALRQHCGQAYAGRIVSNVPAEAEDPFAGKPLVMHVRECREGEIRIPFRVGEDRSRTWVISHTDSGLRLKHDHRHADGSEDALTQYGGDTEMPGTALRQEFPADAFSKRMFEQQNRAVSISNTWAIEIEPGVRYLYELSRPSGRLFQVEFDLSTPVPAPPAPWGHPSVSGEAAKDSD
jgi:hypothetical protein